MGGGVKAHYIHVWMYMYLLIHKVYVCVHVCVNEKGPPSYFLLVLNVILVRSQSPLWPWESPMSGVPAGFGRDLSGKELLGCLELQNWAGQKLPSTNGTQAFDKNFHLSLRKVSLIFFLKDSRQQEQNQAQLLGNHLDFSRLCLLAASRDAASLREASWLSASHRNLAAPLRAPATKHLNSVYE